MNYITYAIYGIFMFAFLVLAGFAVFHAFKYDYISPRTRSITWIFIVVSVVLVGVSIYFLLNLQF